LKLKRQLEKHFEQLIARRSRLKGEICPESIEPVRHGDMVLNARRMSEQVPDCDATPRYRCFRKIFCDCVLEANLAIFNKYHDCSSGELLGVRADFVNRFFCCVRS
jgi:hypothetical protein